MSMYDNDPNRPRIGDPAGVSWPGWATGLLIVFFVALLAFAFWPTDDRGMQLSQKQTTERSAPTVPPAKTTPTPQK
jgi:hypothetical protein